MILDVTIPTDETDVVLNTVASDVDGMLPGPVEVHVHVVRARLQAHYGTGLSEGVVKDSAPAYPIGRNAMERGAQVVACCEGVVWEPGALSAVVVTCAWGPAPATRVRIRQALVETVGDMIARGMLETPVMHPW